MSTAVAPPPVAQALSAQHRAVLAALSPAAVRPRLAAALGGTGACHVLDAKYEPGRRAVVLYRYGDRLVRGDVPVAASAGDPPLVVSPFPDDPELPTLRAALHPERLHAALNELEGYEGVAPPRLRLLRYRPGKRVTLAVHPRTVPAGGRRPPALVAKVYHDPGKAAAVAAEGRWLTDGPAGSGLRLAPVVGHLPSLAVVVQARVPGTGLDAVLGPPERPLRPEALDAVTRAATALAALHGQPALAGRARPVTAELTRFAVRAERAAAVEPAAGAPLLSLAHRLTEHLDAVPRAGEGLVHGDCKPGQFLLADEEVTLLDLDSCGVADQASDVATFVATLRQRAVRATARRATGATGAASWAEQLAVRFVEGYADARSLSRGERADLRRRTRWYEGVALERKALRAFARAPRSPLPAALVAEAHRQMDRIPEERG